MATERYPTFAAGQRATASLLTSGQLLVARKLSDTTRASTTTPTDDPELTFELEADAVYLMDGMIKYAATSTADMAIDWTTPSGALGEWVGYGPGLTATASTTDGYLVRLDSNDVAALRNYAGIGSSSPVGMMLNGIVRVQSTAGTYAMQWAQAASDAVASTVYADSWIRLQRIA